MMGNFSGSGDGILFILYCDSFYENLEFLFFGQYRPQSIGVPGIYYKLGLLKCLFSQILAFQICQPSIWQLSYRTTLSLSCSELLQDLVQISGLKNTAFLAFYLMTEQSMAFKAGSLAIIFVKGLCYLPDQSINCFDFSIHSCFFFHSSASPRTNYVNTWFQFDLKFFMQSFRLSGIASAYWEVLSFPWLGKKSLFIIFRKFYRCSSYSRTYVLSFLIVYCQIYYKVQILIFDSKAVIQKTSIENSLEYNFVVILLFICQNMYQRIKTPDSKATKTFRSKRCKTIGPESCLRQQYKYHTILDTRNVTEMSGFAGMSQFSNMQLFSTQNGSAFKSPRLLDRYDEDNQNLTTDFAADWSRMDAVKRQTYSRLRNKLVKKFPSFRQKYKAEDITEETQPSIRQSKRSQSENKNRIQGSVYSTYKVNDPNAFKNGYFYSRSQKKCLYNSFTAPSQTRPQEQQKQTPIPRLSFLNYIKNNKERQALKFKKVKGQNMIKTRDKILTLQKQGTQSFLGLKKCLEESIEACILSK